MDLTTCESCHYNYVPAETGDIARHRKYHDEFFNGVKANSLKSDLVAGNIDGFKIILVSPKSSLQQRKRAERIAFRGKIDTHFDFASYHANDTEQIYSPLVFIGITNNRAIAFLVLRKTKRTAKVTWEHYDKEDRDAIPLLPDERWGVSMAWTLENKRRKGFAGQLLKATSNYIGNSILEMAWFTPFTESGYLLAKTTSPNEIILTV
jgi:hypothetical protein